MRFLFSYTIGCDVAVLPSIIPFRISRIGIVCVNHDLRFLKKSQLEIDATLDRYNDIILLDHYTDWFSYYILTRMSRTNAEFRQLYRRYIQRKGMKLKGLPTSSRARHTLCKLFRHNVLYLAYPSDASLDELINTLADILSMGFTELKYYIYRSSNLRIFQLIEFTQEVKCD